MASALDGIRQAFSENVLSRLAEGAGVVYERVSSLTGYRRPRAYTDSLLSTRIQALFKRLENPDLLPPLIEIIHRDTHLYFPKGVQHKSLEACYASDMRFEDRVVDIKRPDDLDEKWKRVLLACECQTLPNHTIGGMLAHLRMERLALKDGMNFVKTRTIYRVELEKKGEHLRICLIFSVFMESLLQSLELQFNHTFVVEADGTVVEIEGTKVEKIPRDPLSLDHE